MPAPELRAAILEMRGIRKEFPGVIALDNVSLTLYPGEVHVLLGENGAGKSTLMKILSGAYRKDAGAILMHGSTVAIENPRDALAHGIRVIYQELTLVPHLSVAENIFLGSTPTRFAGLIDWPRLHAATSQLLAALGLDLAPGTVVSRLRLAQRQLVEIAKALAGEQQASVLVMDEPTSALTAREVDQLFALVAGLVARGVAIVYITHRLDEVARIGHRVTVLRDGRCVTTTRLAETNVAELVRLMANRELTDQYPKQRVRRGAELLRVERLGRGDAFHDVSFALHAGEVIGLAGLLGAGRTELARVLAGADRPDRGRVFVQGRRITFRGPSDAIDAGIGLLPEDRNAEGFVAGLPAAPNIALPHGRRLSRFGYLPGGSEAELAEPVARDLRIKAGARQPLRLLSGGNQQKVVLAKWLAGDARVFVFDEPTRGVDVGAKVEIYQLMNRLTADGAGILMISSELPELLGMSDRILVMHRGRLVAELSSEAATQERVLAAALGVSGAGPGGGRAADAGAGA